MSRRYVDVANFYQSLISKVQLCEILWDSDVESQVTPVRKDTSRNLERKR